MDEQNRYLSYLPPRLRMEVARMGEGKTVEEIRLRTALPLSLTVEGESLRGRLCMSEEEAKQILQTLCGGSVHTYEECLNRGYIPLPGGGRAGVVGMAVVEGDRIIGVRQITSIVIRIPGPVRGLADPILTYLEQTAFSRGALLYSPPGVGKTTTLRELAIRLSKPPYLKRVALIDSRMELYRQGEFDGCLCDRLCGYPKAEGITIAVRTLSPQILICDEIGSEAECRAILEAYPAGVPLIASAHGKEESELMHRSGIRELVERGVFGALIRLKRSGASVRRLDAGRTMA